MELFKFAVFIFYLPFILIVDFNHFPVFAQDVCFSTVLQKILMPLPRKDQYLDKLLIDSLSEIIETLNSKKRKQFIRALKQSGYFKVRNSKIGKDYGRISGRVHPKVLLTEELESHPFGRIIFIHESDHLSRMISKSDYTVSLSYPLSRLKKGGFIQDEIDAYTREYNFIRKAYKKSDLDFLEQRYPVTYNSYHDDVEELKQLGIMGVGSVLEAPSKVKKILAKHPEAEERLLKILKYDLNGSFLNDVRSVLDNSLKEYIKEKTWYLESNQALITMLKWFIGVGISLNIISSLSGTLEEKAEK